MNLPGKAKGCKQSDMRQQRMLDCIAPPCLIVLAYISVPDKQMSKETSTRHCQNHSTSSQLCRYGEAVVMLLQNTLLLALIYRYAKTGWLRAAAVLGANVAAVASVLTGGQSQ